MEFYIGQIIDSSQRTEAAIWCNENGTAHIEKRANSKYEIVANEAPIATKPEVTAFISAEADKVAYGGITIIAGEQEYLFKTTTDNITRCNSVLAMYEVLPDDTIIPWEVWQGDVPTMLPVNKAQFKRCFAFGANMIISVETVKGTINAEVQKLTDEQLADTAYIAAFKESAASRLSQVNTVFDLESEV